MQNLVVVFVVFVFLIGVYITQVPKGEEGEKPLSETKESVSLGKAVIEKESFLKSPEPTEKESTVSINTYITSGPKEGEVIADNNKITFEFEARISPEDTEKKISFETKVEGFDEDWKKTSSKKREIKLPSGPKEYTFLVRGKAGETVDKTPAERTFKINTSPYFGKLKISSKSSSRIILSPSLAKEERINITGWRIKGNKGNIIIPQGIGVYFPDASNNPQDIFINRDDKIYIFSSANPMGANKNFRPNKCFGFLADNYEFPSSISFSKKCLSIKLGDVSHLQDTCQDFILKKMRSCKVPDYSDNLEILFDSNCQAYIDNYIAENLNYAGCFENYYKDEDFLENKWYIFTGRNIVSSLHDTLYIYDKEGLVVDKYLY